MGTFSQDWVRATEALVEMGDVGLAPSAKSARQWRLASAAIEEIDIELDEDADVVSREGTPSWGGDGGAEEGP